MPILLSALLLGIVSGLRSMTGIAAISWAARTGHLMLAGSWLAFLGYRWTPWILALLALAELINDKLPTTPSRKAPVPFAARIVLGTLCGIALGLPTGNPLPAALCGAAGALAGTLGGYAVRARLAQAVGNDLPVALGEDLVAIGVAFAALFAF